MADEDQRLLDALPEELREGGPLPLVYYLVTGESADAAPTYRAVASHHYRTKATHCEPYYKPISRLIEWPK